MICGCIATVTAGASAQNAASGSDSGPTVPGARTARRASWDDGEQAEQDARPGSEDALRVHDRLRRIR